MSRTPVEEWARAMEAENERHRARLRQIDRQARAGQLVLALVVAFVLFAPLLFAWLKGTA